MVPGRGTAVQVMVVASLFQTLETVETAFVSFHVMLSSIIIRSSLKICYCLLSAGCACVHNLQSCCNKIEAIRSPVSLYLEKTGLGTSEP